MAKKKSKAAVSRWETWIRFLSSFDTVMKLYTVTAEDFNPISPPVSELITACARLLAKSINSAEAFLHEIHLTAVYRKKVNPAYKAIAHFESAWKEHLFLLDGILASDRDVSHWEKRRKIYELGIKTPAYWGHRLLTLADDNRPFRLKVVERQRTLSSIKVRQVINELDFGDRTGIVANEAHGYYVVHENDSVLFYSWGPGGAFNIELVIIRGVACSAAFSEAFYAWLRDVVDDACHERRNVRPTHPGHISQVGLNNGPWHARVIGPAQSYTKRLDTGTMIDHDREVIGAVSITWSIIRSVIPREIVEHVDNCLGEYGMPRLATRNVGAGRGFDIQVGDCVYSFPTAERAPPEAYLSKKYEAWLHTDPAYCTWAFTLCVARDVQTPEPSTTARPTLRRTRSSTHTHYYPPQSEPNIPNGGGSFTDASLRVVVRQARGTVIAFQPQYPHGTSKASGASNSIISINFSERVGTAWMEAQAEQKIFIESGPGAGEGNTAM